jgi:hypothetical protein
MLYKRSSFIHWLQNIHDCEVKIIRDSRVTIIINGVQSHRMWMDRHDRIDYEEIWLVCNNLLIVGLPGDSDLKRIE